MDIVSKEFIIKDLHEISKRYRKEFPDTTIYVTRDFYRKHGKYSENQISELFGSFSVLKEEALKTDSENDSDSLQLQKNLIVFKNKIEELEREKSELLKRSITEDDIINKYEQGNLDEY